MCYVVVGRHTPPLETLTKMQLNYSILLNSNKNKQVGCLIASVYCHEDLFILLSSAMVDILQLFETTPFLEPFDGSAWC